MLLLILLSFVVNPIWGGNLGIGSASFNIVWPAKFLEEEAWEKYRDHPSFKAGLKIKTRDSDSAFAELRKELVALAREKGLRYLDLDKSIEIVRSKTAIEVAIVPVYAFTFDYEGKESWLILFCWEYRMDTLKTFTVQDKDIQVEEADLYLSHIRLVAVSDGSIVGDISCD